MPNQQQEIDMYRDRFEGNWKQYGGKAEERGGNLANILPRECAGRIQDPYKISNEESARQLSDFIDHNHNWRDPSNR